MARMQRKFADSRAAANEAAARRRGDYNQFERRILNKGIDDDQKRGLVGDFGQLLKDTTGYDKVRDSDLGKMTRDLGTVAYSPFKPMFALGADLLAQGLGSLSEAEKARVGGKFNAPLNVKKGTSAYNWLLDDVIKDEYKDDFRKEVGKDNLYWTELNKYADDDFIGGGQLARGINERNEGIAGTDIGTEFIDEVITKRPGDTEQINATIDRFLAPTATDMDRLYYQSHPEQLVKLAEAAETAKYAEPFDDTVTQVFPAFTDPDEEFEEPRPPFLGGNIGTPASINDRYFTRDFFRNHALDNIEKYGGTPDEINELFPMAPPGGEWPNYRPPGGNVMRDVTRVGGDAAIAEEIAERDRRLNQYPYADFPMVNPPAEAPPPFLGTVEEEDVEEEEMVPRGLQGLIMDQYGVDAPGVPREREWPNIPPPGSDRSWYEKYMAPWFNTGYDYYNE